MYATSYYQFAISGQRAVRFVATAHASPTAATLLDTRNKRKTRSPATFATAVAACMLVASWWTPLTRIKVVCFVRLSAPFTAHTQAPADGWIARRTNGLAEKSSVARLLGWSHSLGQVI